MDASLAKPPIVRPTLWIPAERGQVTTSVVVFVIWLGVTVVATRLHASPTLHGTHEALGMAPCPSVLFFDRPCPACGLTTSWTSLVHGDFSSAFRAHLLGPLLYFLFTLYAIAGILAAMRHQKLDNDVSWVRWLANILAISIVGYGVVRFALSPHYATVFERIQR